jgi:hypothetical protein
MNQHPMRCDRAHIVSRIAALHASQRRSALPLPQGHPAPSLKNLVVPAFFVIFALVAAQ